MSYTKQSLNDNVDIDIRTEGEVDLFYDHIRINVKQGYHLEVLTDHITDEHVTVLVCKNKR